MCWHSYGWRWEREPERTSEPANTDELRIADADRERAISELSKHAGDGRLTLEEFEDRATEVYAAKTNGELRPVFRGLPSYRDAPGTRRSYVRPLVMLALLVGAAIAFGPWVLFIGFWLVLPRRAWGRHRRLHHDDYQRLRDTRDEDLTTV